MSKKRLLFVRVFCVGVLVLAGWGLYASVRSPLFNVSAIDVADISSLGLIDTDEIVEMTGVVIGRDNLFQVDLAEVEARILTHPWVKAVRLMKRFPQTLSVEVISRAPVAILQTKGGGLRYLESDGVSFDAPSFKHVFDLPVVNGVFEQNSFQMNQVMKFLNLWIESGLDLTMKISSLTFDEKKGFRAMVTYPLKGESSTNRSILDLGIDLSRYSKRPLENLLKLSQYLSERALFTSRIWLGDGKKIVVKMGRAF